MKNDGDGHLRAPANQAQVALLAASHVVDDIYQGAVPALLPFFIDGRHYSYTAANGADVRGDRPVVGDPAGLRRTDRPPQPTLAVPRA